MAEKDPNQMAAEKLDKETKKVQEEQRKQFDMPRKNMPGEPDQGPLPPAKKEQIKRGLIQGIKGYSPSKEVSKFDENYKKGGKVKCMAKGGTASARADGCATKGKTKGRII